MDPSRAVMKPIKTRIAITPLPEAMMIFRSIRNITTAMTDATTRDVDAAKSSTIFTSI